MPLERRAATVPSAEAQAASPPMRTDDYATVQRIIRFTTEHQTSQQPSLDVIAAAVGLTPRACHQVLKRWCGVSPKEFLATLTLGHAHRLLAGAATVLEAAETTGLSGSGRLHDLVVSYHAVTPGQFKARGAGLELAYGVHPTPFGDALFAVTSHGLAALLFIQADDMSEASPPSDQVFADLRRRWPAATLTHDPAQTEAFAAKAFPLKQANGPQPLRLVLIGNDFEVGVWQTLLRLPVGQAASYGDVARHIKQPTAARAVGAAVGRNPISFVVPCHRILRSDGQLGGYHWGLTRKRAIIGWEAGRLPI